MALSSQIVAAYYEQHLEHYLDLLRQMVAINSFTANAAGVNALGNLTAGYFESRGFQKEFVASVDPNYGQHLFLSHPASGAEAPTLVLISHLDTVFPPEEEQLHDFRWKPAGDRIYGPGTVDIKGGTVMIAMLLDGLRSLASECYTGVNWLVCLDASEETLSDDFAAGCLQRMPENTRAVLVFEGGTLAEKSYPVVTARKGRAAFRVAVEGKSAHAGNNHANGANAIVQLASTIQKIAALTDYKKKLTFNVGTVKGGVVVNRVPHYAEADVEMRSFDTKVFAGGAAAILALNGKTDVVSQDGYPCKVSVVQTSQTAPWPRNAGTERLFEHWQGIASQLGMRVTREERGGLSDGNFLWQHFPTLDGLGPTGSFAHCSERDVAQGKDQEFVLRSSFVPKAVLNTLAIEALALMGK